MRLAPAALLLGIVASSSATATDFTPASTYETDKLAERGFCNLKVYEANHYRQANCTTETAHIRHEWSTLTSGEKLKYVGAVQCLMALPPKTPQSAAPGVRNRYDDFVATHINQTLSIHGTGNFLSWHRYFTWTYEQALRNECNYTGTQPYLDWGRYAYDILDAPVFDGSSTSMSGNGAYKAHNATGVPSNATPYISIPPGNGSGCVTTGPFRNMSVNLGPVAPALVDVPINPQPDGLGYNPRCLRRDISPYAASTGTSEYNSTLLLTQYPDIASFQTTMQGSFAAGLLGVHTAGHFIVGGDPGGDLFTSPGDPYFFLHHAQIDRTWWIWQNLDLERRQHALAGTITVNNEPPSRNATLDDVIQLGVNAGGISIRDALSTLEGPFCYIYR